MKNMIVRIGSEYWVTDREKRVFSVYKVREVEDFGWEIYRQYWDMTAEPAEVQTEAIGEKLYWTQRGALLVLKQHIDTMFAGANQNRDTLVVRQ